MRINLAALTFFIGFEHSFCALRCCGCSVFCVGQQMKRKHRSQNISDARGMCCVLVLLFSLINTGFLCVFKFEFSNSQSINFKWNALAKNTCIPFIPNEVLKTVKLHAIYRSKTHLLAWRIVRMYEAMYDDVYRFHSFLFVLVRFAWPELSAPSIPMSIIPKRN